MNKNIQFDVYTPDTTISDVTDFYVGIIISALEMAGCKCSRVDSLKKSRKNKDKGILVIDATKAILARCYGYKHILYWIQGIMPEESYMRNASNLRSFVLSIIERIALKSADLHFFVSEQMRKHYFEKYHFSSENYYVMPCFNDDIDSIDKKNAGFRENIFLYAGRIGSWAYFDETAKLYKKIEERNQDSKFLILTSSREEAKRMMEKYDISNYEIDFVKQDQLKERIKHCKFGFCLREKNEVNYVATPTKFSTYVANGIMPIYSSITESFSDLAKNNKYCICADDINCIEYISELCNEFIPENEIAKSFVETFGGYYSAEYHEKEISKILKNTIE